MKVVPHLTQVSFRCSRRLISGCFLALYGERTLHELVIRIEFIFVH